MDDSKIDPFKGVVKPDVLKAQIIACVDGDDNADSYLRGAIQYLERRPPNKHIVPLLQRAREKRRETMVLRS